MLPLQNISVTIGLLKIYDMQMEAISIFVGKQAVQFK